MNPPMLTDALLVALATVALGLVCGLAVGRLPRLGQQLVALAAFAAVTPVLVLLGTGALMLDAGDALALGVTGATSGATVVVVAGLLARRISRPVTAVHDAARELAAGDLGARVPETGPRETAELAAAFNEMAGSVERTFDARSDLIAWASHDLRTPVSSLVAMIEAIEDGVAPPERYLAQIGTSARQLRALVEDLFDLARTEREPGRSGSCDATAVAAVAVRTHGPEAARRGLAVELRSDRPATTVAFDELDLHRVLDNLCGNALRHARSLIVVTVDRDGVVGVADDGDGFPPDALLRAFEPFWRADVSRQHDGAGLGLAIVARLAQRQGATVQARNDGGAVVTVRPYGAPSSAEGASANASFQTGS